MTRTHGPSTSRLRFQASSMLSGSTMNPSDLPIDISVCHVSGSESKNDGSISSESSTRLADPLDELPRRNRSVDPFVVGPIVVIPLEADVFAEFTVRTIVSVYIAVLIEIEFFKEIDDLFPGRRKSDEVPVLVTACLHLANRKRRILSSRDAHAASL